MTASPSLYDLLVEIASWGGPSYIAGRVLGFDGHGYDPLLLEIGDLLSSVEPSRRRSCLLKLANAPYGAAAARLSSYFGAAPIEGKTVTIRELFRGATSARTMFKGVVRQRSYDLDTVELELVETALQRSRRLDKLVDLATFARAKPADVGRSIPLVFNDPTDVVCPVVAWNAHSRTAAELDSSSTADLELDSAEGFPSSGTIRIDREQLTYTGITANALTGIARAANSTVAAAHIKGALVVVVDEFDIAIDSVQQGTTVTRAEAVDSERRRYPLPDPDSHEDEDGIRKARWDETPTYFEPAGELDAHSIELDQDGGSNSLYPERARARDGSYSDSNYCEVHRYSGTHEAWIGYSSVEHPTRGRIKKILLQAVHSGNNDQLVVASGKSNLGTGTANEVKAETQTGSPRLLVGYLAPIDQLDSDFLEIAERKGGRATQSGASSTARTAVVLKPTSITEDTYIASYGVQSPGSKDHMIDGDYSNAVGIGVRVGAAGGRFNFSIGSLPPGINSSATLDKVVFKWRHGGSGDTSANNATIALKRSGSTVAGATSFASNASSEVDEVVSYNPTAKTVADLTNYVGVIEMHASGGQWRGIEGWFEIDYTDTDADQTTGAVVNQFDVTSIFAGADDQETWGKVSNGLIDIRSTVNNTGFRLYQAGFIVIYEPLMERVPDRVALSLDGGINGNIGSVINTLWQTVAGNSAGSINSSDVSALDTALAAAGFTAAAVSGVVREEDLWATIQRLARECRFRAYALNDVLRLAYIPAFADLAATSRRIDHTDLVDSPRIEGADIDRAMVNLIRCQYDYSEIEEYRGSLEDTESASVTAYGERLEELELRFVRTSAAAQKLVDMILERQSEPYDAFAFRVTLALRDIALLDLLELRFDFFSCSVFEVEEIEERGDHTLTIKGRVLVA